MTHVSPLGRRAFAGLVLSILCVLSAGLTAGQNPFSKIFGGDKNPNYQVSRDPAGRFELEILTKDWRLLSTVGSSLAVFANKDGPTMVVDYVRLAERLTPAEIELMSDNDVDKIKSQDATAKDFKPDMCDTKAGRGVLIRYSRMGSGPEVVVHCSIPVGLDLYRLYGVIPEKQVSKDERIIMHMIQSFKAPADPAGAKK